MELLWFCIVAYMITMYVILDGFDLGVGVLHLFVARTEEERRTVLAAIGPVWDGNEVWLLAGGGTLFFAFPKLYASSFSGFYLPLMIVLWLLMMRGLGIELRHHVHHPMWRAFWDAVFSTGSLLLAVFFGAALGNVVRGVPLDANGHFFEPLWTTFTVVPEAGILDWFTVSMGLVALFTLTVHGANYLAMKTEGNVQTRSRSISSKAWYGACVTSILVFIATWSIHPEIWNNYQEHLWGFIFPTLGVAGLIGMFVLRKRNRDTQAFLSSSVFIGGMLASTAFGLFPKILPASTDPAFSLTVYNTAARAYGLGVGVVWWTIGIVVALGYFTYLFYSFRGKVRPAPEGEGY
ncbi:MAG: cytochrome d ubiquinol oxidase subunit II [Ignavibacteriae bacterium]|nr:cytochrome d ubiquinol oxidase subunit II [Ignavibacteriota bacterium]